MNEKDDDRLAAAFRAAADTPPEAGFDLDDVLSTSHRVTRRRRTQLAGGFVAAAVLLGGGGVTAAVLPTSVGETTSAAAPARESADSGAGAAAAPRAAAPNPAPLGPTAGEDCVPTQDPALRALVDAALPPLRDAAEAPTTLECRPGAGREVALDVVDGEASGLLSVVYTAPGEPRTDSALAVGWVQAGRPTASGGYVSVTSRAASDSGAVPFRARVQELADALAPQL
ncbi:MAG: hypothetical protein JWP64_5372 [Pseudonocardia sp.]|uniref:hypothetical protein n=1 Tax=Pseudonocardia sp. TaxID=60912 RepID=UPI002604C1B1|nr:hypothetical protein [Pseudonocardia sp.]MCU1630423.1 hypothetical protein [Pseudonocardia sp.]